MVEESPLNILHLCAYPLFSGPVPPTLGLAAAQRNLGHTVKVAFDRKRGAFNDYEEAAAPYVEAQSLGGDVSLTLSTKANLVEMWRDLVTLRRLVRRDRIDVLHVHMSHDHALATLALIGEKTVVRVRTIHAARSLEQRFGQRWLNGRADGFVVRTHSHTEMLCRRFGTAPERVRLIAGGIDSNQFAPPTADERRTARAKFNLPSDAVVIGHVALIAKRGQEQLLDALVLSQRPDVHLLFAGRGEAEIALKNRAVAAKLANRVHFLGYVPARELRPVYAAMDAAYVPQAGNDASARAALEAMGCGLPVVAVKMDALGELVTETVGYPIASRDPQLIAAAIDQLADHADERARRGEAARAYVAGHRTFANEALQTVAFYRHLRTATAESLATNRLA